MPRLHQTKKTGRALWLAVIFVFAGLATAYADAPSFFTSFTTLDQKFWYLSNGWANGDHQACEWRATAISVQDKGLEMRLSDEGGKVRPIGCAEMHTQARLGYGLFETRMRVAAGSGLNTAFFTYIGPPLGVPEHDEIDFEFLGKDPHFVQINYFTNAKGHHEVMVPLGFDASKDFHNYGFEWLPNKIRWYVDGKLVHETPPDAVLPRNPALLFLSLWSGSGIEDSWLGHFQYTDPVTADVAWTGFTPAGESCKFPQSLQCK